MFSFQEQDFKGIGEQISWWKSETEFYEETRTTDDNTQQSRIGSYIESEWDTPEVDGHSDWKDWLDKNS